MALPLGASLAGYSLNWTYNTARKVPVATTELEPMVPEKTVFGELGFGSLHRRVIYDSVSKGARVTRGDGDSIPFTPGPGGTFVADADIADRLAWDGLGFRFIDMRAQAVETYGADGRLLSIRRVDGRELTMSYSTGASADAPAAGYLLSVQDTFGRSIEFKYELPLGGNAATDGRVKTITLPQGQITLGYTGANLTSITWPDTKVRQFRYERSDLPWALTGVVDENSVVHATIGYDASGRAISSVLAGGVESYAVAYTQPPVVEVTDVYDSANNIVISTRSWRAPVGTSVTLPNGTNSQMGALARNGLSKLTSQSQPAGSGCAASSSTQTYDANGNTESKDDFNGHRVCYGYDSSRNLELARVEGLPGGPTGTNCATVTGAGASLPPGARKVSTQWHPEWRLAERVAEPNRITYLVYNGRPDPFTEGATAWCAPSAPNLPGGQPIAALCKRVEQATSDATGAAGLNAAPEDGVPLRVTSWTYNSYGQILTQTDPTGHTTTNTYYPSTSFAGNSPDAEGHTAGDLATVTTPPTPARPQGLTTVYDTYDRSGRVRQMTDPNGVATTFSYHPRGWLKSATTAGQTASYEYWPTGLLKLVTRPDGSWLYQEHDDAHRLRYIKDNFGNSITYTLDNLGNRTAEDVRDPGNVLRRSLGRGIDALGRVQQITGRE